MRSRGGALSSLKHYKQVKFAWDNPKDNFDEKIELLLDYIKPSKLMCYVLIGFWSTPEEDLMRVMHLWDKYKIHAFVMPYDKFNRYQKDFARWCNTKIIFKSCSWSEYQSVKHGELNGNKLENVQFTFSRSDRGDR